MKNLIEYKLAYTEISKNFCVSSKEIVNFHNSKYSSTGTCKFPYDYESATVIVDSSNSFTNIFDLLLSNYFKDELNLFASSDEFCETNQRIFATNIDEYVLENSAYAEPKSSQEKYFNTLVIASWSYEDVVFSAVFCYLEKIYSDYCFRKIKNNNTTFFELKLFTGELFFLFLNKTFSKKLFKQLKKTNIFNFFPEHWLYGLITQIKDTVEIRQNSIESCDRLDFYKIINSQKNLNFIHTWLYLEIFSSFIPLEVRRNINQYIYITKNIHILYYVLQKYQNVFDSKLKENEKEFKDLELTEQLQGEVLKTSNLMEFDVLKKK